jgi:hypothetical protein
MVVRMGLETERRRWTSRAAILACPKVLLQTFGGRQEGAQWELDRLSSEWRR